MKRKTLYKLVLFFSFVVIFFYVRLVHIVLQAQLLNNDTSENDSNRKRDLSNYIQGWNITRDVNWLLNFAIVGFPKTGTSTLMLYLKNQTESIFIFEDERCEIAWGQQVPLLKDLHRNYQPNLRMGIKCPSNLEVDLALKNYDKFFPSTKFIIGLRHPVLYFQSFYNFRITNGFDMPPAQRLIGKCRRTFQNVCTQRANFSRHLEKIQPSRKVFLYDVSQLRDHNRLRATRFRQDLAKFLDLKTELDQPMIWVKPGQDRPVEEAENFNERKINICDDKYANLRRVLLEQASSSSTWIRNAFIANPNVQTSSPEFFSHILDTWHYDPCNTKK